MPNLVFPQLASGTMTQYPVRRTRYLRTIKNMAEDGTPYLYCDVNASIVNWELAYTGLTTNEMQSLLTLFDECGGPYRGFTFLDPVGNLLSSSWQLASGISQSGTTYTNSSGSPLAVSQTLPIPASYQYCFSIAVQSTGPGTLTLIRRGAISEQRDSISISETNLISSGQLTDSGTTFTVAIELLPGQSINLTQWQLQAQMAPGSYQKPTLTGGVYTNAHWAQNQLIFTADGPDSFSTTVVVEARL